jgi:hypothetical protein
MLIERGLDEIRGKESSQDSSLSNMTSNRGQLIEALRGGVREGKRAMEKGNSESLMSSSFS